MALTTKSLVFSAFVAIAVSLAPGSAEETRRTNNLRSRDLLDLTGVQATLEGAIEDGKQWSASLLFNSHGYKRLVVIGDSLSDEGNVYALTQGQFPPSPPYGAGYYSNGPVWAKFFADSLSLTSGQKVNYAHGGSTSTDTITGYGAPNNTVPVPSAETQINKRYLPSLPTTFTTKDKPITYDLHVLMVGGNDVIQKYTPMLIGAATNRATTAAQLQSLVDTSAAELVANIFKNVDTLYNNGARTVLVADGFSPSESPFFNGLFAQYPVPAFKDAAIKLSTAVSQKIAETVSRRQAQYLLDFLSNPQVLNIFNPPNKRNIALISVSRIIHRAYTDPAKFGITEINVPCFDGASSVCANPDATLFWDVFHPTSRVHKLIASEASRALLSALLSDPTIGN